jgi:tetratricopeptide (TPR) repeat protein
MSQQVKKTLVLSIYFALAVSTLLVFWQVRNFDFINYDDSAMVYENPNIQTGITLKTIKWAFYNDYWCMWHPLTWFSHMLDWQLFGSNAGGHHLVNLIFHIANTLLLFTVLRKITGSLWPSAFVAALFALHPMHVESVAWIAERKDVLSTFFWLLTMWAYTRFVNRPKITNYLLIVIFFALGLMAKPMLVTLPFVLLLSDYWPLNRIKNFDLQVIYRLVLEKIPFFALSVISSVITFLVQRSGGAVAGINKLTVHHRIANVFLSYAQYIDKMFWPSNLAVFYPFDTGSISFWKAAACAFLLLGISLFVVRLGRNQRYLLLGWFWFLGTLIPVIGIVQVGLQTYADRYTYIPYIGLFIMIAWSLPELLSKWPQRKIALGLSMVSVLMVIGICSHRQVSFWKNNFTLFSHANEVTQNNYLAYNNLGTSYGKLGRWQDEIEACKKAVGINPDYADAHCNLGFAYGNLGRWPEAIEACKQAIKIKPDYAEAHSNLGVVYSKLSRYQEAIEAFRQAIRVNPDYADAHYNLGFTYGNLGHYQEAIDAFKQAIRIKPDDAEAHGNLGFAYLAIGDRNSALAEFNILKSLNSELANNLFKEINK